MNETVDRPRTVELLEAIAANTREIATWLQIAYGAQLKEKLEVLLDDARKLIAYEYSDGENSSRAVAQAAGASDRAIRDWWREWMEQDIVEPSPVEGRFRRRFSLRKFGIEVPGTASLQRSGSGKSAS